MSTAGPPWQIYDGIPTFLGIPPAHTPAELAGADAVIIGVPYVTPMFGFDGNLTPHKIRQASRKYSGGYLPELDIDVFGALKVVDYGDARIEPDDLAQSVANVQAKVADALAVGALPITLGGSAPCSGYSAAAALSEFYGGKPIGAINLDAHGDNRESWQGSTALMAGTWVRHQLRLPGFEPHRHMQIGMRGPGNPKANADWYKAQGCGFYTPREMRRLSREDLVSEVIERAGAGAIGLWFGIDWDVLDMSVSPDWSYPEPLGISADTLLHLAYEVGKAGCLAFTTMSGPAHSDSMHWIAIWSVLYLLAGTAVRKGRVEDSYA
ncbi:MAG: arginase family protein [Anaerolineae bacterium]